MKTITSATISKITRNLTDFGYDGLTVEEVQKAVDNVVEGEKPTDIVGMFVKKMLVENGYIED